MFFVVVMDVVINVSLFKFNGYKWVENNLVVLFLLVKLFFVIRIKGKKIFKRLLIVIVDKKRVCLLLSDWEIYKCGVRFLWF